jgi:hypothetical protein
MLLLIQKEDIESLISGQKAAVRMYCYFAVAVFGAGILLLIFGTNLAQTDTVKTIFNIGGAFISTLTAFPVKEIINRRDKINTYNILKRHVILITEKGDEVGNEEKKQIMDLIMEVIKNNALKL